MYTINFYDGIWYSKIVFISFREFSPRFIPSSNLELNFEIFWIYLDITLLFFRDYVK